MLENISKKVYPKMPSVSVCRELPAQIKSMSYLIVDSDSIRSTEAKLREIVTEM